MNKSWVGIGKRELYLKDIVTIYSKKGKMMITSTTEKTLGKSGF